MSKAFSGGCCMNKNSNMVTTVVLCILLNDLEKHTTFQFIENKNVFFFLKFFAFLLFMIITKIK